MQKWRTRPRSHVGLESDVSHRSWPFESQQVPYGGPWMAMGPLRSQGITTSIEDSPGSLSSVNRELFHPEFQLPKVQGDVIRAYLGYIHEISPIMSSLRVTAVSQQRQRWMPLTSCYRGQFFGGQKIKTTISKHTIWLFNIATENHHFL